METYIQKLYEYTRPENFCRSFRKTCGCGKSLWSIGETATENVNIKAFFICPNCGKRTKEVVYKKGLKKYRYPQAIAKDIYTEKFGKQRGFELDGTKFLVLPDKIVKISTKVTK